jgi:hypothetical protein
MGSFVSLFLFFFLLLLLSPVFNNRLSLIDIDDNGSLSPVWLVDKQQRY